MNNQSREQQLEQWARKQLKPQDYQWSMVSGDASFRRYFRLQAEHSSYICVDAPAEHENNPQFVKVATMLASLNAPKVIAKDYEQGFMLLSDLGDQLLLPLLLAAQNKQQATVDKLYRASIDTIIQMQQIASKAELPAYDQKLLTMEMELFRDWFVAKHLKLELTAAEHNMLSKTFRLLSDSAEQQPQVFVHRDFHSRNIMLDANQAPAIIDFQDAVYGPITYDLLSLLRDCYIQWPAEQLDNWMHYYLEQANAQLELERKIEKEEFRKWFDWMGLQRHIKVAGIFSRLNYRDGKAGYLKDLPLTLTYIVQQLENYSQLQPFKDFMQHRILPAMGEAQLSEKSL